MPPTAQRLTPGIGHYFHGYYDIQPWDLTERYFLCLRVGFRDRRPTAEDRAALGVVDTLTGAFTLIEETTAWNFQQGTMAHWLGTAPDREVIFNSVEDGEFVSVVRDVFTGERRVLQQAVGAVSHDGCFGLGLSFSRLAVRRPGYGYEGVPDRFGNEPFPEEDGISLLDIQTGERHLVVPLARIASEHWHPVMAGSILWFNHVLFNASGTRFAFLARFAPDGQKHQHTAMFTANRDGSDLYRLIDYGLVSHYDWLGDDRILVWAALPGDRLRGFYLHTDRTGDYERMAPDLSADGHCSVSPDSRWFLNDSYPDETGHRPLMLVPFGDGAIIDLGRFYSPTPHPRDLRCDLHPCWSRSGRFITFDSVHEGFRACYRIEVPVRDLW